MNAAHKARLLTLASFLDKLDPKKFDFLHWVGSNWGGKPDLSCGTTACALGWATTIPEFRALGLHLRKNEQTDRPAIIALGDSKLKDAWLSVCYATEELFGLSPESTSLLFTPDNGIHEFEQDEDGDDTGDPIEVTYPSHLWDMAKPIHVAENIRAFLEMQVIEEDGTV